VWFALLLVGAIALAAASKSPRAAAVSSHLLPAGPAVGTDVPGPIAILSQILRGGQAPPANVVFCAIAEAQARGDLDLAATIAQTFVPAQRAPRVPATRGACALTGSPRGSCARPVVAELGACVPSASQVPADGELLATLHADPTRFLQMIAARSMPASEPSTPAIDSQATLDQPAIVQEAGSPIPGVSDVAWQQFVARLAREAATFSSSRHVGQYRHRRERLAEIGLDPSALEGSAAAQRAALDVDLVDAHHHATEGGLVDEHLGRAIAVPGSEGAVAITLSGLLGVIQCAGLDGAVGWLERPSDRRRYPHTTQAFLNTNGVF
jgi:hypothetical protein